MTDDPIDDRSPPAPSDAPAQAGSAPGATPHTGRAKRPRGLPRLLSALLRLADLQYQIWLARAKLTALKLALFAALWAAALLLALLALIFLYLGTFRLLTDQFQIPTSFAFLIFAALHLLLAVVLGGTGYYFLQRSDELPPGQSPAPTPPAREQPRAEDGSRPA